jgi:hypothetical protein
MQEKKKRCGLGRGEAGEVASLQYRGTERWRSEMW